MAARSDVPRVPMQVSRGVVVASVQVDLDEPTIAGLQSDLLGCLEASRARGVILDVSGLETLDAFEFEALRRIGLMASLMGARPVLAGLQPGVVSALIETDVETEGVVAARDLDAAFALLEPVVPEPAHDDDAGNAEAGPDDDAEPRPEEVP